MSKFDEGDTIDFWKVAKSPVFWFGAALLLLIVVYGG